MGEGGITGQSTAELRSIIDAAHEAFISMDAGGFIIDWNPQSERTFGWSRREALGQVLADLIIPASYREAHWAGLQRFLDTGEGPVLGKRLELVVLHREGYEFPVELSISAATAGDQQTFHAFLHDISDRKRGERYAAAQHAVTAALAASDTPDEAARRLLPALAETLDWEVGGWWEVASSDDVIRCRDLWFAPDVRPSSFERLSRELAFERGMLPSGIAV